MTDRPTPAPAPEVVMDANGAYWRRYPDALSMCPVSDDNEPLAEPAVVYRLEGETWPSTHAQHGVLLDQIKELHADNERLREALRDLAQRHHDTITGSRLHDPESIASFTDCSCKSCVAAASVLDEKQ